MARVNLEHAISLLQDEYVNGEARLKELASKLGCSWVRLAQIGKAFVPGYIEAASKRKEANNVAK